MVRRKVFIAGVSLVLASIAVTASAQQPGGGFGGFGGLGGMFGGAGATVSNLMLLRMQEVRTELKVTEQQSGQIDELLQESTQTLRDSIGQIDFQGLMNGTQEDRQKMIADIQKKVQEGSKGLENKIPGILNADQNKRLRELLYQRLGASALLLPEVGKAIGLSADKQAKIKAHLDGVANGFTPPAFNQDQSPEDMRTAMQAALKKVQDGASKAQAAAFAELSDDETLAFTNLCGKTFKFPANAGLGGFRQRPQQQP